MTLSTMLRPRDVVAIDCEFVSTSSEESHTNSEGRRVVTKDATLALARVSCLRSTGKPFIDDYIQKRYVVVGWLVGWLVGGWWLLLLAFSLDNLSFSFSFFFQPLPLPPPACPPHTQ